VGQGDPLYLRPIDSFPIHGHRPGASQENDTGPRVAASETSSRPCSRSLRGMPASSGALQGVSLARCHRPWIPGAHPACPQPSPRGAPGGSADFSPHSFCLLGSLPSARNPSGRRGGWPWDEAFSARRRLLSLPPVRCNVEIDVVVDKQREQAKAQSLAARPLLRPRRALSERSRSWQMAPVTSIPSSAPGQEECGVECLSLFFFFLNHLTISARGPSPSPTLHTTGCRVQL